MILKENSFLCIFFLFFEKFIENIIFKKHMVFGLKEMQKKENLFNIILLKLYSPCLCFFIFGKLNIIISTIFEIKTIFLGICGKSFPQEFSSY